MLPMLNQPLTSVVSLLSFELILNQVAVQRKRSFVERVLSYWVQKRQSRNNVPLIRRLQANPQPIRDSQNVSVTRSPLSVATAAETDPGFVFVATESCGDEPGT